MADDKNEIYFKTIEELQERLKEKDALIDQLKRQVRDGIFCNKSEIMQAYDWSEYTFAKWIKMGLPCRIVDRVYYAHRDNIALFFREYTKASYKGASDDVIEAGK